MSETLHFDIYSDTSEVKISIIDSNSTSDHHDEVYLTFWEFEQLKDQWDALAQSSNLKKVSYVYDRKPQTKNKEVTE